MPNKHYSELIGDDRQGRVTLQGRACRFPVPCAKRDLHGGGTALYNARTRDQLHIFSAPSCSSRRYRPMIVLRYPRKRPDAQTDAACSWMCREDPDSLGPTVCMDVGNPFPTSPHRSPKSFQHQPTRALVRGQTPRDSSGSEGDSDRPIGPEQALCFRA